MKRRASVFTASWVAAAVLAGCGGSTTGSTSSGAPRSPGIAVERAFSRATPPGVTTGVLYLDLTNSSGQADRLLEVSTPAAARVEVHETSMTDGMMRMRPLAAVDLPDGRTLHFAPESLHLMLVGLAAPLAEGATLAVTLRFEHAAEQTLQVPVRALGASVSP